MPLRRFRARVRKVHFGHLPLARKLDSADAFALDARLRQAVRLEQQHLSRVGPLLLAVSRARIFRNLGYRSLGEYARDELGIQTRRE